jgi:hypothetical protein
MILSLPARFLKVTIPNEARTSWKIDSSNDWWLGNEVEAIEPNESKAIKWEEKYKRNIKY